MLKLRLEPGQALDRQVEAAARHLEKLLEEAIRTGYIRVAAYPRPDSVMAAAAFFSLASQAGASPVLTIDTRPPPVEIPTLVLGFNNVAYKGGAVDAPLMVIAREAGGPPPPGAVYVDGDGSVPAMLALIVLASRSLVSRGDFLRIILAAMQYGGGVDKKGRAYGIDRLVYDEARKEPVSMEEVVSIKVYKPLSSTVCDSLTKTLDPVYPGLLGDPQACRDLLAGEGLAGIAERTVASLDDSEMEKLAVTVLQYIQDSGIRAGVEEYVGSIPVLPRDPYFEDVRMLAHTIVFSLEEAGSLSPLLSAALEPGYTAPALDSYMDGLVDRLSRALATLSFTRHRVQAWLRTYKLRSSEPLPPTLAWRVGVLTGRLEEDSIVLVEEEGGLCASALQAEQAAGPGIARRIVEARAGTLEGARICLAQSA